MRNIFIFLVLLSLLKRITADPGNTTSKISDKIINKDTKFGIPGPHQRIDEIKLNTNIVKRRNELKKSLYKRQSHFYRPPNPFISPRKYRNTYGSSMECLTCYAKSTGPGKNCYSAISVGAQKCADFEQCFTEVHPEHIKRGCALPSNINRTFVCKCPLCNDKPSEDRTYYEYKRFGDWEYDNLRLGHPLTGVALVCKVCATKGINATVDKLCKDGKEVEYMLCAHDHLCYTNIDNEIGFVSRGCILRPAFNSFYTFCNKSLCNTEPYPEPNKGVELKAQKVLTEVNNSFATNTRKTETLHIIIILTILNYLLTKL